MNGGDCSCIWQATDWPSWRFDLAALAQPLADASRAQGLLAGRLADVGMGLRDQASLSALTEDVVKTSEIEGEHLDVDSVRSSIARRLGVDIGALAAVDRHDGNGRIARAVGDLFLARADGSPQRFYSLSAQIQRERKSYYDVLERTQKASLDVTDWLAWFLGTLHRAIDQAQHTLDAVLVKARFWQRCNEPGRAPLNERQVKLVNRLLDGFEGKLTSSKWAVIAKCSPDTALRDITDLLERGLLRKSDAGGHSTSYELSDGLK